MINSKIKFAGGVFAIGIVGAAMYIGSAGQGYTPGVSMPVGCNGGESPQWDGTQWQCRTVNDYRGKDLDFVEEFVGTSNPDWIGAANSGTGASASGSIATTGRPGIIDLSTGTTAAGVSRWNGANASNYDLASETVTFEVTGGWPTLSASSDEYTSEIGLGAAGNIVDQTNGCVFLYDRGNVAVGGQNSGNAQQIEVVSANASTRTIVPLDGATHGGVTTVSTPVAALTLPNTNIHTYTVVASTSQCIFKVDQAVVATLTTNIPATVNHQFAIIKSAGLNSRDFYVDRAHLHITFNSARSP